MIRANELGYVGFEAGEWRPASGHPSGWRVVKVRDIAPTIREHVAANGRLIIYRSFWGAQKKAVQLNISEGAPMRARV